MALKKKHRKFGVAAGLAAVTLAIGGVLWVSFGGGAKFPVQPDYASEIVDGDTFYTARRVKVRLGDLDAPEMNRCGGKEAAKRLSELIMDKPLFIKTKGVDRFGRGQTWIYTRDGLVNLKLIEEGLALYVPDHEGIPKLKSAGQKARSQKIGIFGSKCTQEVNLAHPKCNIKGNVNPDNKNTKIYYIPSCGLYKNTAIELFKDDVWFCSEKEAINAGFRASRNC